MKLERNENFSVEEFSDGEVMLYDNVSEVYHILNITAAYALATVEKYGYEDAKKQYVSWAKKTFGELQDDALEEDYDGLITDLINKKVLILGNTTV